MKDRFVQSSHRHHPQPVVVGLVGPGVQGLVDLRASSSEVVLVVLVVPLASSVGGRGLAVGAVQEAVRPPPPA
jgi:hypothetical protein